MKPAVSGLGWWISGEYLRLSFWERLGGLGDGSMGFCDRICECGSGDGIVRDWE